MVRRIAPLALIIARSAVPRHPARTELAQDSNILHFPFSILSIRILCHTLSTNLGKQILRFRRKDFLLDLAADICHVDARNLVVCRQILAP